MNSDAFHQRSPRLGEKLADKVSFVDGGDELPEVIAQIMAAALFSSDLFGSMTEQRLKPEKAIITAAGENPAVFSCIASIFIRCSFGFARNLL